MFTSPWVQTRQTPATVTDSTYLSIRRFDLAQFSEKWLLGNCLIQYVRVHKNILTPVNFLNWAWVNDRMHVSDIDAT